MLVKYIENYLDLPQVVIPKHEVSSREDVERAAESCRKAWEVGFDTPIVSMTRTVERAGIVVTTFEGVSDKVDAFSLLRGRPIIVRSMNKDSTSRARFDLAHECGHFVMHDGIVTGEPDTESEANQFASAFLLPRAAFIREFPKGNKIEWRQIFEMKKRWGVSIQAIVRRAYDLGIFTPIQYRNANVYISRKQWKKNEPCEPKNEYPEIIPAAINYLFAEEGLRIADIADQLNLHPGILFSLGIVDNNIFTEPIS
jgi:Zn-dependent peptidase ImmA (M78 family)